MLYVVYFGINLKKTTCLTQIQINLEKVNIISNSAFFKDSYLIDLNCEVLTSMNLKEILVFQNEHVLKSANHSYFAFLQSLATPALINCSRASV